MSFTLAVVVTSAVRGTTRSLVVIQNIVYFRKPIPYCCMTIVPPSYICINARTRYYSFFFHRWFMPYRTFCFIRVLSIAVIEGSARTDVTIRYPIGDDILSFISVGMVFNRLSNVRLLLGIVTRPQSSTSFRLYWQSGLRKVCNSCWNPV